MRNRVLSLFLGILLILSVFLELAAIVFAEETGTGLELTEPEMPAAEISVPQNGETISDVPESEILAEEISDAETNGLISDEPEQTVSHRLEGQVIRYVPDENGILRVPEEETVSPEACKLDANLIPNYPQGDVFVPYGSDITLTFSDREGNLGELHYAWYEMVENNNDPFRAYYNPIGSNTNFLTISNVVKRNYIACEVQDAAGNASRWYWYINVENGLTVTPLLANLAVKNNSEFTMTVTATANDMTGLTYSWYRMPDPTEANGMPSSRNCHEPSCTCATEGRDRSYMCLVRDRYDTRVSAMFNVRIDGTLQLMVDGSVEDIVVRHVPYGQKFSMEVTATPENLKNVTYTWTKVGDSSWKPSANQPVQISDLVKQKQVYRCTAKDSKGNQATVTFELCVANELSLTAGGTDASGNTFRYVQPDTPFTLEAVVHADDMSGMTYEWYCKRYDTDNAEPVKLSAVNSASRTFDGVSYRTDYILVAKDRYGQEASLVFQVYIDNDFCAFAMQFQYNAIGLSFSAEAPMELYVTLTGKDTTGITTVWSQDGERLDDVEPDALSVTFQHPHQGLYRCLVTDRYGTAQEVMFHISVSHSSALREYEIMVPLGETMQIIPNYWTNPKWTSEDEEIATVDATGTVTGVAPGKTYIIATYGDNRAVCEVTVTFLDVQETTDYFYNPVYWAVARKVTSGYTDKNGKLTGYFGPADTCTRAQIVTFLYRAAGSPAVDTSNAMSFKDVKNTDYFYKAVIWAAQQGITTGYTDKNGKPTGYFGSNDPCTRGQVVTFLWRAAGKPKAVRTNATTFRDVKEKDYFFDAVVWAATWKITTGYTGTKKFGPDDPCTRGQVVTFLYRAART